MGPLPPTATWGRMAQAFSTLDTHLPTLSFLCLGFSPQNLCLSVIIFKRGFQLNCVRVTERWASAGTGEGLALRGLPVPAA